jgi:hypothetical protein
MFHIWIENKNLSQVTSVGLIIGIVPLLYNALCPSAHDLLYDLRIKSFGLRDKPRMHRYIELLVCGKLTAS